MAIGFSLSNESTDGYRIGKTTPHPKSYRCHVAILREENGTFSAVVLNLPGVGSCGDTEAEALANAKDAAAATIASYLDDREDIPWDEPGRYPIPEGCTQKWVLVDA